MYSRRAFAQHKHNIINLIQSLPFQVILPPQACLDDTGLLTKSIYSQNSIGLEGNKHKNDSLHMNKDYGVILLKHLVELGVLE